MGSAAKGTVIRKNQSSNSNVNIFRGKVKCKFLQAVKYSIDKLLYFLRELVKRKDSKRFIINLREDTTSSQLARIMIIFPTTSEGNELFEEQFMRVFQLDAYTFASGVMPILLARIYSNTLCYPISRKDIQTQADRTARGLGLPLRLF